MKSYCVKQKKETSCVPGSERIRTAKNGRQMSVCVCSECGISKTQFVRNDGGYKQTGRGNSENEYTCGLDPKKQPYSMKKCLDMKQVRYWGKEKIDPEVLALGSETDMNKKRMNLISRRIPLNAALKKLKSDLIYTNKRDRAKIQEIKDQAAEIIKKRDAVNAKLQKIDAELGRSKPKTIKKVKIPKLPKEKFYEDPMIDARYRVLMKEHEKMMKKEHEKMVKKKPAPRNLNLQITRQDLEKGVDQIIKDVKIQCYDLTPSEIKIIRKQIKSAIQNVQKKPAEKNTKAYIKEIFDKIPSGGTVELDNHVVVNANGGYYFVDLNMIDDEEIDIDYEVPNTFSDYVIDGLMSETKMINLIYNLYKNNKKIKPDY